MSTVEIETGRYITRFAFWEPATWSIPRLYWDTWSQEQRIHAICRQLEKVIAYSDCLGTNLDDVAARLKAIEEGQLEPVIVAAVEKWFEENEPEIVAAIEEITRKFENNVTTVSVVEYGADRTGSEDSTQAIQDAIDAANDGDTVLFPHGEYLFGNVEVEKNLTIDFDGSVLTFNERKGMIFQGTLKDSFTYVPAYTGNTATITSNAEIGDLVVMSSTQRTVKDRTYYTRGFTAEVIKANTVSPTCPVNIQANSNCEIYTPVTVHVKNVGDASFTDEIIGAWILDPDAYPSMFFITHALNSTFENIHAHGYCLHGIWIDHCVNTIVDSFNGNFMRRPNDNSYPIGYNNSSYTKIMNCNIMSEWHAISGGGQSISLHTIIENCNLNTSTGAKAYLDHSNCWFTTLSNCTIYNGASVSIGAVVQNCKIMSNGKPPQIQLLPTELRELTKYTIQNCRFQNIAGYDPFDYTPLQIVYSPWNNPEEQSTQYISKIVLDNCSIGFPTDNSGYAPFALFYTNAIPVQIEEIIATNTNFCFAATSNATNGQLILNKLSIDHATYDQSARPTGALFYVPAAMTFGKIVFNDAKFILGDTTMMNFNNIETAMFTNCEFDTSAQTAQHYISLGSITEKVVVMGCVQPTQNYYVLNCNEADLLEAANGAMVRSV